MALLAEGVTYREAADLLGVSFARIGQWAKTAQRDSAASWGPVPTHGAADRLQAARDAFTAAQAAQAERETDYAMGYATERKAFYGDPSVSTYEGAEDRVRFAGFHQGVRAMADAGA